MSPAKTFALIVAVVLIGPVMFIFARGLSLARGFDKVQVGDPSAAVIAAMGQPQEEARTGLSTQGDTEYRYRAWPVSTVYVVALKDGKVLEKGTR
jgi:hypothetical protein